MRNQFRTAFLGALALAMFANAMSANPVRASDEDQSAPQFEAMVGDRVFAITEGAVVYQAEPAGNGLCEVDQEVGVGATIPNQLPIESVSIAFEPNEQCEFIITDISLTQASPTTDLGANIPSLPPAAPGLTLARVLIPSPAITLPSTGDANNRYTVYKGWTKGRIEEYVNIDTNQAYSEFRYFHWRDSSGGYKVDKPHAYDGYCWSDHHWIWVNDRCEMRTYDQEPAQQWYESFSHFHSSVPPRPDYTLYETYFAQPTFWNYDCSIRQGKVPTGWDHRCEGGRKVITSGP